MIGYQGYAGPNAFRAAEFGGKGQDQLDGKYYTYVKNAAQTRYQLLGLLESDDNPGLALGFPGVSTAYAGYESRYPLAKGHALGALLGSGIGNALNQPVQELYAAATFTGVDVASTTANYRAYVTSEDAIAGTGADLSQLRSKAPVGTLDSRGGSDAEPVGPCAQGLRLVHAVPVDVRRAGNSNKVRLGDASSD